MKDVIDQLIADWLEYDGVNTEDLAGHIEDYVIATYGPPF